VGEVRPVKSTWPLREFRRPADAGLGGGLPPDLICRRAKARYEVDSTDGSCASSSMPCFSIHVSQGKFSSVVVETAFENSEAARQETMAISADLGRDIFTGLVPGSEWQMDLKNEIGNAIFRLRLNSWILE
jgi:hypothetical protein